MPVLALTAQAQAAAALAVALPPAVTIGGAVAVATSSPSVILGVFSAATVTDPRDGGASVTGGAVNIFAGLLDEGGGSVLEESGGFILLEDGS